VNAAVKEIQMQLELELELTSSAGPARRWCGHW